MDFNDIVTEFDKFRVYDYLVDLNFRLSNYTQSNDELNYPEIFAQLTRLISVFCEAKASNEEKNKKKEPVSEELKLKSSLNLFRLLSRNLVEVLSKLPNKVYDTANGLIGHLAVDENGALPPGGQLASILLIDIVEHYPQLVSSLINFAANHIYKILKKNATVDCNIVYLLSVITQNALKSDVDEKLQAKWIKLILKTITLSTIRNDLDISADSNENLTVLLIKYYIAAFRNILILLVTSNYELLLEFSASSSSGSKLKPEAIMTQQHQFQSSILSSHEKLLHLGLSSRIREIRSATVELLANLLFNFVETGKFSGVEYLLDSYPLPNLNLWNEPLKLNLSSDNEYGIELKKERNLISNHDSESIINANTSLLLLETGIVETFILYVLLGLFQNWDFYTSSLCTIFDLILCKFGELDNAKHFQNQQWNQVLLHWSKAIEFIFKESGSTVHDILTRYVVQKFTLLAGDLESTSRGDLPAPKLAKDKMRESGIFSFKSVKSNKSKGPNASLIKPYSNPYQLSLLLRIVELLLPFAVDFNSLVLQSTNTIADLPSSLSDGDIDSDSETLAEEEDKTTTKRNSYISDLLITLLANESEYIRNYSLATLIKYARINHSESNQLILRVFQLVTHEYNASEVTKESSAAPKEKNTTLSVTMKLFSYSLALSSLIKESDATLLQNSTIAKILSFCTQNLKHSGNSSKKYLKNAACWITLTSLVNFHSDSEFVKLNSSQFLVFWKNLLTSQFITSTDLDASEQGLLSDVTKNLKLRTLSLICLLNYINSVHLTPELSKQLQFLLVKSHSYLTYLESKLEEIGLITNFSSQAFNESDYNPNMINNLIFSNYNVSTSLSPDKQLISLILYNKKVVLQGFTKLAHTLKSDVNSSLVVFLLRVFSDPKTFSRLPASDHSKEKTKTSKVKSTAKVAHEDVNSVLLEEEYNFNFGVTSKFQTSSSNVDELLSKSSEHSTQVDPFYYNDAFEVPLPKYSKEAMESNLTDTTESWLGLFENMVTLPSVHSVNYDPAIFLLHDYSLRHKYSTNLMTSLVDLSIELFQLVFPTLSFKIQFSLLEQLRASLTTKNMDPLRRKAVEINLSVAIHGLLNGMVKKEHHLDEQLVSVILATLEQIELRNAQLITINADSVGLACTLLSRVLVDEKMSTLVNDIVNDTSPYRRGYYVLSLAKIYEHTHLGFSEVYNVISQLLKDPNPVMSYYSLSASAITLGSTFGNQALVKGVVDAVYVNFLDDAFGFNLENRSLVNLRSTFNCMEVASQLLKLSVTSLGPNLRDCDPTLKVKLMHMLLSQSYGIGFVNLSEYISSFKNLMSTFQEILVFDANFVDGFSNWFADFSVFVIKSNMKTGVAVGSPTSINKDAIFPVTTSFELYEQAYSCLVEMTKIGFPTLNRENASLAWASMELQPCAPLKSLVSFWVESNTDIAWFTQLSTLFKISSRKLVGNFMEVNYQQKLLPLLQRQKKKTNSTIEFKDEEVQNIVDDDNNGDDKNEPITWEFKLVIYDLLIKLLTAAEKRSSLLESLKPKIQEIVRISFLGTTSPIGCIKLRGVELLDKTLGIFGHLEDPVYPSVSILEQQQAQIISALIPCFGSDSDASVIVRAINVSSKFINLPRIKFYSKQRILKTLIYLLEEISSNKFLKFVFLESIAEYGRKAIQLSILNCWAVLKLNLGEQKEDAEPEFEKILKKYSDLLTSLWILVLKDLSTLKYSQPNGRELSLYSSYWLNFVGVLSLELEKDHTVIKRFLGEEESNFFFVLFCQCAEALIKNQDVSQVLISTKRLVQIPELVQTLFSDEIFGEVIDLFDRLVLMEDDTEIKCEVIDTVSTLFGSYTAIHPEVQGKEVGELFELMRVTMLPLFDIFPFLRQAFNPEDASQKLLLKRCNSGANLLILKKLLSTVVDIVQSFLSDVKPDLCSCVLYVIAKFYEYGDQTLISVVLPHLKTVISVCNGLESDLINPFYNILKQNESFSLEISKDNYVITMMILITSGDVKLDDKETNNFADTLLACISNPVSASTGIQSVRSLVKNSNLQLASELVMKYVLTGLLYGLVKEEQDIDAKVAFEIIALYSQSLEDEAKLTSLYAVLLPLLLDYEDKGSIDREYLHGKIVVLLNHSPNAFKVVVNEHLGAEKRVAAENLVKFSKAAKEDTGSDESEIQLKTFG